MKLLEAIDKYRNEPKSVYNGQNWVQIGKYLEPHLDEIEKAILFMEQYEQYINNIEVDAKNYLNDYENDGSYRDGKIAMMKMMLKKLRNVRFIF